MYVDSCIVVFHVLSFSLMSFVAHGYEYTGFHEFGTRKKKKKKLFTQKTPKHIRKFYTASMEKEKKKRTRRKAKLGELTPVRKRQSQLGYKGTHGAPAVVIDEKRLEELAECDYTMDELAAEFGVHLDTIYAKFSEPLKRGRLKGQGSIKRQLFAKAMKGDLGALIWVSKNRCGYRDKQPDEVGHVIFNVQVNEVPK